MEKSEFVLSKNRVLVCAAIGICLGAIVFIIANNINIGDTMALRVITAFLSGLSFFASSLAAFIYSRYKRIGNFMEDYKKQTSLEWLEKINSRSILDPYLEGEVSAAKKEGKPISIIMADLDHFKEINSTYGNVVGDHILSIFALTILKCLRKTDIIARYGGDEIIVVLPDTDSETAGLLAEKMREEVARAYIPPIDDVVISSIHCSIGVSTYPALCDNKDSLISTSEIALYMAKRFGRNCTKVYREESAMS